jgi:hypothetical protein
MIALYHCERARSFRPLWMMEEVGLAIEWEAAARAGIPEADAPLPPLRAEMPAATGAPSP